MKQLSMFDNDSSSIHQKEKHHWKIFIDGASRNNPGPSGAGIFILKDDEMFLAKGYFLKSKTNNQAEYFALLLGLYLIKKHFSSGDRVHFISDSQLLVRQVKGEYRVRHENIIPLHSLGKKWVHELNAEIFHVLRFDNKAADEMANLGIDKKTAVPREFLEMIQHHGISL